MIVTARSTGVLTTNRMPSPICLNGLMLVCATSGAGSGLRICQMATVDSRKNPTDTITPIGGMNKETSRPPRAGPQMSAAERAVSSSVLPRAS